MFGLALLELFWGLLTWPFVRRREVPRLVYVDTPRNRELVEKTRGVLKGYTPTPWASGPNAQTFFSVIHLGARPVPRKELVTMPDGVQVILLWFERSDIKPDAPCVISLHGIGGDENSVRPIMLAEECLKRGWRSVMYVRRGHGDSSLLPVGAVANSGDGAADGGPAADGETFHSPLYGGPPLSGAADAAAADGKPQRQGPGPIAEATEGDSRRVSGNGTSTPVAGTPATAADTATATATGATNSAVLRGAGGSTSSLDSLANCLPKNPLNNFNLSLAMALQRAGGGSSGAQPPGSQHQQHQPPPGTPNSFASVAASVAGCIGGVGGGGGSGRATPPLAQIDPEVLKATRKAFPQHADTEDFQAVLQHIHAVLPEAPLVAVGFSMGTNVLVKFVGEVGPDPQKNPLTGAVSVCNGYDIVEGTRHLVSSRALADRVITASLHKLLRRKLPEVHAICAAHGVLVDFDEVLSCNTIRDFERALMLPIYGHDDLDTYYQHNNCKDALRTVGTPLLCMSAKDDPIIDPKLLRHAEEAASTNPNVILALTERGGHLGWMRGWRGRSWMMEVIIQYVEAIVETQANQPKEGAAAAARAPAKVAQPHSQGAAAPSILERSPQRSSNLPEPTEASKPLSSAASGKGATATVTIVADGGGAAQAAVHQGSEVAAQVSAGPPQQQSLAPDADTPAGAIMAREATADEPSGGDVEQASPRAEGSAAGSKEAAAAGGRGVGAVFARLSGGLGHRRSSSTASGGAGAGASEAAAVGQVERVAGQRGDQQGPEPERGLGLGEVVLQLD
ncbi:hypothetical protein HYH02_001612 [Chlamydomonas schloesseri]|uniref:AB hydrolase-1 domain-containing protein n=1 Tax=Chlamydomonas schloesseri TaxID=2026947 RepID=A0A835WSI2_9CHLO|nr:hypothetical protein HYH02_001612 [Chlamydomonas schloesseri]|eukprot:KAG2453388.1 hypothetical protein HYH02_001612 [Chlamydomonas schloesseri]